MMIEKITVFYSKSTKKVKAICGGEQDFSFFSDDGIDMAIIYDRLIIPYDQFFENNYYNFIVDGEELVYVPPQQIQGYNIKF